MLHRYGLVKHPQSNPFTVCHIIGKEKTEIYGENARHSTKLQLESLDEIF